MEAHIECVCIAFIDVRAWKAGNVYRGLYMQTRQWRKQDEKDWLWCLGAQLSWCWGHCNPALERRQAAGLVS